MRTVRTWTAGLGLSIATLSAHAAADVSSSGKGTVGGGLLGAELTVFTEALLGVQSGWAYAVGAGAGAAAGGVAGFVIEDTASPGISMAMLTSGMVLVIPATIAVMSSTRYTPPTSPGQQDQATSSAAASREQATAHRLTLSQPTRSRSTSLRTPVASAPAFAPSAIRLDLWQAPTLSLSLPAVEIRDAYTRKEVAVFGVEQEAELRIPVFDLVF